MLVETTVNVPPSVAFSTLAVGDCYFDGTNHGVKMSASIAFVFELNAQASLATGAMVSRRNAKVEVTAYVPPAV